MIVVGPRGGVSVKSNDSSFGKKSKKKTAKRPLRTNESLWKRIVAKVKKGSKGGNPGQWSARKAQMAVRMYKEQGGGYRTARSSNNSLVRWTKQKWRTKSGRNSVQGSRASGERYLPDRAIKRLSDVEYKQTSLRKRKSIRKGKQFSRQPKKIARKVRPFRQ